MNQNTDVEFYGELATITRHAVKKPKAYVAGPMRHYELHNFPAFDAAAASLRAQGYIVVNPADIDRAHGFTEHDHIYEDELPALLRECIVRDVSAICNGCTHIALLPGWEKSTGARVEKALAEYLGLEVLYV